MHQIKKIIQVRKVKKVNVLHLTTAIYSEHGESLPVVAISLTH